MNNFEEKLLPDNLQEFKKDLETLINKHSLEQYSDTPDYILAYYLTNCLLTFNSVLQVRENWYGRVIKKQLKPTRLAEIFRELENFIEPSTVLKAGREPIQKEP